MAEKVTAIKCGTLIDGNGGPTIKNAAIVIKGQRIQAVGAAKDVKIPKSAEIINVPKYTVMPGMMDLHIHLCMYNNLTFKNYRVAQWEVTSELQQMYMLFHGQMCLDRGFTTLRDLGFMSSYGLMTQQSCAVRDSIDAGIFAGPRILSAAFTVGTGSHLDLINPRAARRDPEATADGPDGMRKLARKNMLAGVDWLKTCASGGGGTDKEEPDIRNHTPEELRVICEEAHMQHKHCAIHCFTPEAQLIAIEAGADTLEHMVFNSDEAIEKIVETQIPITPTLSHRTDHAIDIRREIGTPQFTLDKMKQIQPDCFKTFQKLYKAGANIAMGTDMGFEPGFGTNGGELVTYVELGMKPMDAIVTATRNAARALHLDADLGTLEKGKIADIVVVDGDPSKNIKALEPRENIKMVLKEGYTYVDRRPGKDVRVIQDDFGSWRKIDA
jgi:imidazolonepropionase-like amidohydrolase